MSSATEMLDKPKTIDLGDGVERECKFTLNAMAELEDKYGSIEEAFEKIKQGRISAIRFLLWCILIPDGEELTEKQVGSLISLDNLNELMDAIMDMFNTSMPDIQAQLPNRTAQQDW